MNYKPRLLYISETPIHLLHIMHYPSSALLPVLHHVHRLRTLRNLCVVVAEVPFLKLFLKRLSVPDDSTAHSDDLLDFSEIKTGVDVV